MMKTAAHRIIEIRSSIDEKIISLVQKKTAYQVSVNMYTAHIKQNAINGLFAPLHTESSDFRIIAITAPISA